MMWRSVFIIIIIFNPIYKITMINENKVIVNTKLNPLSNLWIMNNKVGTEMINSIDPIKVINVLPTVPSRENRFASIP